MTATTRVQLTLFLTGPPATAVEAVRRALDPIQAALIPAHVTCCREDELADLDDATLAARLATPELAPLALEFGRARSFAGHGVLLPCVAGDAAFRALRARLLGPGARPAEAHVTLAHPRNPRAPGNLPGAAAGLPLPLACTFASVARIAQSNGAPWRVLATHPIGPGASGS